VRGIGICAGLDVEKVPGATGYIDTNYAGKVEAALRILRDKDFVYLHIEAPDEAGHSGNWKIKKQAIEDFDAKVIGSVVEGLQKSGKEFRMLVMPDHATPIEIKTHSRESVPFIIYPAIKAADAMQRFTEIEAARGEFQISRGHELMDLFVRGA
jgi:2,3-bisphosphoglycerate-independent phosphoglycerate mutase